MTCAGASPVGAGQEDDSDSDSDAASESGSEPSSDSSEATSDEEEEAAAAPRSLLNSKLLSNYATKSASPLHPRVGRIAAHPASFLPSCRPSSTELKRMRVGGQSRCRQRQGERRRARRAGEAGR